jgi:hypothetical protein
MPHFRSSDTKLAVMREAVRQGHPEVALTLLSATPTVRAYVRSPSSRPGWQINDWDRPFPDPQRTKTIILVDMFDGPPEFYVIPADKYTRIVRKASGMDKNGKLSRSRPVNQESRHCCLLPRDVTKYLGRWDLAPPPEIEGFRLETEQEKSFGHIDIPPR